MKMNSLQDLLIDELRDLYSAEHQLTKALPKMAKASSSSPLQQAFNSHLEETKLHVERLEQAFKILSANPKGETCEGMEGLIEEAEKRIKKGGEAEVLDAGLIADAQRVEHYEIAAYGCSRTFASLLQQNEIVKLLDETLQEEKNADAKLSSVAQKINMEAKAA